MKFLRKINRQYLLILTVLLIIVSLVGYLLLRFILENEIKEDIFEKEYAVVQEIKKGSNLPNIFPNIETKKISQGKAKSRSFKIIYLNNKVENHTEPFLEYTNTVTINDQLYLVKIRHSLLDRNDLLLTVAIPLLVLLILTLLVSFLLTKKMNKTVWADFENNLHEIENFNFNDSQKISLLNSGIEEFDRLNTVLNSLTERLKTEYFSLKEFAENASHEIQTPLSIVLLNLEELLQQDLSEEAVKQVLSSQKSVKRLSKLNRSLVLLTKIENNQFEAAAKVMINDLINQKVQEFDTFFEAKKLKLELNLNNDFTIFMNEQLAGILIGNLLSNAIKHNTVNGIIKISSSVNEFNICNSGPGNSLNNETIFRRFTKHNSESFGLGLAIVKKICDTHNLCIHYSKNELHCFQVKKKSDKK